MTDSSIDEMPVLYSFRRCPYAMRARMAIAAAGQRCALREVVLANKPPEMIAASPKGTVPVLALGDRQVIEESLEIMYWALGRNDPEGWLTPLHDDRAGVEALIAENDGPFKDDLDRYKYPTRYQNADPAAHRAGGLIFLEKLDARLNKTAYLCGDDFSLADAAIAPFVRQFANTDRAWFDALALTGVQRWLQVILESDRFLGVMEKYPAWETGMEEPVFPPA
ncbi:glutathione S-transferase [Thalassospiraceae bacterium LMO-JJ14]|nr:glutathione S-transferase [Thalassospiraceae bacterium LMO-JJ14]